jgi:hypothetical protein
MRFEPYPPTLCKSSQKSLLAIRILELLTPVTRLSGDEYMKPPVPGELLTVDNGEGYVPWAFRTRTPVIKKAIADLLQSSAT